MPERATEGAVATVGGPVIRGGRVRGGYRRPRRRARGCPRARSVGSATELGQVEVSSSVGKTVAYGSSLRARLEGLHEGHGARPPVLGLLGQGLHEHPHQRLLDLVGRGERDGILHVLHQDRDGGVGGEGHVAGEELVGDDAESVDVGPPVHLGARGLFGGHVLRGAADHAGLGELVGALQHLRDAEVGQVDALVLVQQDVLGLHVAVHDALAVRVGQRLGGALENAHGRAPDREPSALDDAGEGAAGHEAQGHPRHALLDVEGVDRDDVRMLEAAHRLRLAQEPLGKGGVVQKLLRQDLERDMAVELGLVGLVDRGHASAAQGLDDPIGSGVRAGRQGHASTSGHEAYHPRSARFERHSGL